MTKQNDWQKNQEWNPAWDKGFQARDIKSLVHNQGKATWGGREWVLKTPSWNDPAVKTIISDPQFTAKPIGKPAADGKWSYEIHGNGKTTKIIIGW